MEVSPEERTVLSLINSLKHHKIIPTLEAISTHTIWVQQGNDEKILVRVLDQLLDKELISCKESTYSLTQYGLAKVKQFMSDGFSAVLVAAEQSTTSQKFCKQVFGVDLCQFNSMSMTQLDKLLEVLNLSKNDYILDLGCGVGKISEYISDITGASVLGVDFAAGAIKGAKERTHKKKRRVTYQVMDMEELEFQEKNFSCLISIDAIHFVNDIKRTIQLSQEYLRENAQMGIFYSVTLSDKEPINNLEPEQTPLAKALFECGLNFQTWDFTEDELGIWEKVLRVAEELKKEYEMEGKSYLYDMTISDARPILDAVKNGKRRRYLYHIQ